MRAKCRRVAEVILPIKGSRRQLDFVRLIAWPPVSFGFAMLLNLLFGVTRDSGCQGFRTFLSQLLVHQKREVNCTKVGFLVDIPMVILSLTTTFAAIVYMTIIRRLESMPADLLKTGLLSTTDNSADRLQSAVDTYITNLLPRRRHKQGLLILSLALVAWLYFQDYKHGGIFVELASKQATSGQLRSTWWANYHHRPVLAVTAILLGTLGVYYAFCSGLLYIRTGTYLSRSYTTAVLTSHIKYVPRWRDKTHGWQPMTTLVLLIYASAIDFAASLIAIFDMLRTGFDRAVAEVFGSIGLVSDLAIAAILLVRIVQAHKGVRSRVRAQVARELEVENRYQRKMTDGQFDAATRDLENWGPVPIANPLLSLAKIAPGLYALFQFARTISHP